MTQNAPLTNASRAHEDCATERDRAILIVSHSNLFYWWPVWLLGFILGGWTVWENHHMVIVPANTEARAGQQVDGVQGPRDVVILPEGARLQVAPGGSEPAQPQVHISADKNLGGLFVLVLLLVVFITNVSLRGIWSVVVVLALVATILFLAWMRWWDPLLQLFGLVHIYINASGYLILAACLLVLWLLTTFVFDRLVYTVFTPGQFRVHMEIGEGATAFDVVGMVIQKKQNDLFRHWILGLGSGDLIVKTGGANSQTFEIPNVLFVGHKVAILEAMLQEREVLQGHLRLRPRNEEVAAR